MARWRGGAVARWRGGAVARWRGGAAIRASDSQSREPVPNPLAAASKLVLFCLLQFTQLY